jgi:hypothetical protein
MFLIPSSMVKTAPHFGHFTLVSLLAIPVQPTEKAAKNATARTKLTNFFTPLHLLSFYRSISEFSRKFKAVLPPEALWWRGEEFKAKLTNIGFLVKKKIHPKIQAEKEVPFCKRILTKIPGNAREKSLLSRVSCGIKKEMKFPGGK